MTCISENVTMDKAARAALDKDLYGQLNENSTAADRAAIIRKINEELYPKPERYVNVEAKGLPARVRKALGLESDSTIVERYKGFLQRTTDATKAMFVKTWGAKKATEFSMLKDNITKRDTGTLVHSALENIYKQLLATGSYKNIKKYEGTILSTTELKSTYGLTDKQLAALTDYVKIELAHISDVQKSIDPNGVVEIFNEAFIPDPTRDSAGTLDILVLYSDSSADILDFKTIYPYVSHKNAVNSYGAGLIAEETNHMPLYKINDISTQMRINKETVLRTGLAKTIRRNRAIPINVNLVFNKKAPKGSQYEPKINSIAIGEKQDPALQMVAVDELTGIANVDNALEKLRRIENNYSNKLENSTGDEAKKWARRLKGVKTSINSLILHRDLNTMIKETQELLSRYYDRVGGLRDINNEFINKAPNPAYLSQNELNELIKEFQAYIAILSSSKEFYVEMGMTDKEVKSALYKSDILLASMSSALTEMREIAINMSMSGENRAAMADVTKGTFWQKLLRTLSQINHPVFAELNRKLQNAFNKSRLDLQGTHKKIQDWDKKFDVLGQELGKSRKEIYKMFVNEYGNIHNKYTGLSKIIKEAMNKKDKATLNNLLQLKSDATELRATYRDRYMVGNNPSKEDLAKWDKEHDFGNVILNPDKYRWYYEVKENPEYYSDGYKAIAVNPVLLEFWHFWQDTMEDLRNKVGMGQYEVIPNNFLPWIRQDVIDMVANGSMDLTGVMEYVRSLTEVKEDDMFHGVQSSRDRDPETGAFKKEVPLWFTTPLHNMAGKQDSSLKSIDLLKSLYVFSGAVNEYHYLKNEVEPHVEALKDIIVMHGQKIQTGDGRDITTQAGVLDRLVGKEQDWVDLFNKYVDYHVYGVKIQDAAPGTTKFWLGLKQFQQIKELAFAPAGNWVQQRVGAYFEGLKGYFYTREQLTEVEKMSLNGMGKEAKDLYNAIRYFFEPNSDISRVNARDLSMTGMQKWVGWDTGFLGFRLADHALTDNVMVAMMKNYGFDSAGNIKRLAGLPKGTKSLFDGARIENGKFVIDGFMDKNGEVDVDKFTSWRSRVINATREIRGGMTPQDMSAINMSLAGSLFMTFKNWMPGMIDARASRMRYDYTLDAIVEGKYTALLTDMGLMEGKVDGNKAMLDLVVHGIMPSVGKLLLDISTFGWAFNHKYKYKINEDRAKAMFEAFKAKFPNTPQIKNMNFQDFLDYKQGQMRSAAAELSAILALTILIAYLRGEDDDGEVRWKKTAFSRTSFRLLNRAKREISFFFDFEGMTQSVLKSPIPLMGLLEDTFSWSRNTRDELGDVLWGELNERDGVPGLLFGRNRGKDTKPLLYETTGFIPGNKFFKALEVFSKDTDAEY